MIFVCLGSREYQFNRLLKEIDKLIENELINDEVFAQIGQSDYIPKNYTFERFLSSSEFKENQNKANLIISHAGTGALMGALKLGKKVVAVPRLAKYGEHTDNHQLQIANLLDNEKYLKTVINIEDLEKAIKYVSSDHELIKYNKSSSVLEIINNFIVKSL